MLRDDALAELNRLRQAARVPAVTLIAGEAAQLHSRYLNANRGDASIAGLRAHTESPQRPAYTSAGAAAASRSNICFAQSGAEAVQDLFQAPLHRHWMLRPQLSRIAIGHENQVWVFDLSPVDQVRRDSPAAVVYPGPGQEGVPRSFSGEEVPNPLTGIMGIPPNAITGYPITLHGYGADLRITSARLTASTGERVPIYYVPPGTILDAVGGTRRSPCLIMLPRTPLRAESTYRVEVGAVLGAAARMFQWSFTTRSSLKHVEVSLGRANGSTGWRALRVDLRASDGEPARGARFISARWRTDSAVMARPELKWRRTRASDLGRVEILVNLAGELTLELRLDVVYDGHVTTIPVRLETSGLVQVHSLGPHWRHRAAGWRRTVPAPLR